MNIDSLFLPTSLNVGGKDFEIRTDWRDILRIIFAMNDPDLSNSERARVVLMVMYKDYKNLPDLNEAIEKAMWFIACGNEEKQSSEQKMMDWEHDLHMIIPPINRVAGHDVRSPEPCHWWTFISHYNEIGECHYATIFSIRYKRMKHEKLEKWEKDLYKKYKDEIDLPVRLTQEELDAIPEWARSVMTYGD